MDKPFSIIYNETRQNIFDVLNNSKLHPCVLLNMLTPIYLEIQNLANDIANEEQVQYLKYLQNQNTQESTHAE